LSGGLIFGLYGAGGFAREVMPLVRRYVEAEGPHARAVFVETHPRKSELNGVPVLSEDDFLGAACERKMFNIAIADGRIREELAARCIAGGAVPHSLAADDVVTYDRNEIGEGAILVARALVTSDARIGRFFHANCYSYVAHDCVIGDFVTFAPRVSCNGNVRIGHRAYIGAGAVLRHGTPDKPLTIGEGAVVGMGAVVTKNVAPHTTVIGNPARAMEKG
jgi:sugar O-acyltransferase (sialic acid O-acetyltransferase NeuD family)